MNTSISTFHFRLHNFMAHMSNALKLSQSFDTQWNLSCWKYIINKFYFGTNTKSTNLRIHELVIFNQTMKIDAHEEKYFHSNIFNLCNPTPEFSDILWHLTKINGPKVFLLTKIKPKYSDILYNLTHFPVPLVSKIRQVPL
jgi:hypothetical protein